MRKIITVLVSLILATITAQTESDLVKLDDVISKYFNKSSVKGLEVTITNRNEIIFNKGYGENLGKPITADTPLFIGSTSKVITGLAIAILKDQGKLGFDDLAVSYLPHWRSILKDITIKDLLHHHSGISQESGYNKILEYEGNLGDLNFKVVKGKEGIYSSANIAILGEIIEVVSELSYAEFVTEHIFKPLQMYDSSIPSEKKYEDYYGYTYAYGLPIETKQMKYGNYIIPAGYIVSTSNDLSKFNKLFLNHGMLNGKRLLDSLTITDIFTPYNANKETGFGKTWGIGKRRMNKVYGHEGMTKISNSKVSILPDQDIAISIIANTNSGPFYSISSEVSNAIIDEILNEEPKLPLPKELIIRILFMLLTLKVIIEFLIIVIKWKNLDYPKTLPRFNLKILRTVVFTLVPLIVLIIIPKIAHVPLSMFLRIMPDLGIALLISGLLSLPLLILKLFQKEYASK